MRNSVHREITQLSPEDSFLVYERVKDDFDFPIHFHPEYELNFIYKGKGVRRIIGDHTSVIDDMELVLVGPNLVHGWELNQCTCKEIYEITVHIQQDLLNDKMLSRRIFKSIRDMFNRSKHGILFSQETTAEIMPRLMVLSKLHGIQYFLEFISILNDLALSEDQSLLSTQFSEMNDFQNSERIKKVYEYIQENYHRKIGLNEISQLVNMSPVSFNRFIKKRTGKTFINYVNDTRISYASRWLIESEKSIGEISFQCGFNNIANFNRIFKKSKDCTPSEFRKEFVGMQRVL
ncbi:AraC family transcriptional regulator [Lutimonas zeaxanthinifaciens]|uniref:AraC family transcriptional regulator n=1 Tax=Lutimonas zeaxanthinifaciens TaxID=3060215 RepID=UPI00265D11FE|nr:AraC family transcriptional regulator [Lutimonas sp. YSD2104]WKK65109.1 AraC family transcriptional regulator [Lutimonas sp. YSD2104]